MRLGQPFTRALISIFFCLALALVLLAPRGQVPAQARPLQQLPPPTNNPAQPVDLVLQTGTPRYGNAGATITSNFILYNNTAADQCENDLFTIEVQQSGLSPGFPGNLTIVEVS